MAGLLASAEPNLEVGMSNKARGIPLADFVVSLRDEIKKSQASADPTVPIEIQSISVEFTVLSSREGTGNAGVKFWVVDAGVSGKLTSESTQKVTMELTPLGAGGVGRARISDRERG